MNFKFIISYPLVRINDKTEHNLVAISNDNILSIYKDLEWNKEHEFFSKPEKKYSYKNLCNNLKDGRNTIELSNQNTDSVKRMFNDYEIIKDSRFKIYKWNVLSNLAIIDYSCIHDYKFFGNEIENGIKKYVPFLRKLQEVPFLQIIVISNNSISEYGKIKKYFRDDKLDDVAIMLNPGKENYKDEILKELKGLFLKREGSFYLRISKKSKENDNFDPYFDYDVHMISENDILIKSIAEEKKDTILVKNKRIDHIDKLVSILPTNKTRRRRIK